MKEEIFGPILPIVEYRHFDHVINGINEKEKPLAIYYLGNDRKNFERLNKETSSGSLNWNEILLQAAESSTGFGGVGHSGMGRIGGYEAFK